ncbi:MAG TPA: hypothetical protein VJ927_10185, partial [Actinomycetota bacterium]|nr:hypothetical protein [Actinomycetota bacterium]
NTGGDTDPVNTGGDTDPVVGGINAGEGGISDPGTGGTGNTDGPDVVCQVTDGGSAASCDGPDTETPDRDDSDTDVLPIDLTDNDGGNDSGNDSSDEDPQVLDSTEDAPRADSLPGAQVLPAVEPKAGVGALPFTGSNHVPLLLTALVLIATGGVVLLTASQQGAAKK